MPPKIGRRPAAGPRVGRGVRRVAGVGAAAKGRPGLKAKAKAGILRRRRPAGKTEEEEAAERKGEQELSEAFARGDEVEGAAVPPSLWKSGQRVVVTRGVYWEEPVVLAGLIQGVLQDADGTTLKVEVEGSPTESLVTWAGLNPGRKMDIHLCSADCPKMSREGLTHGFRVRQLVPSVQVGWMNNLVEVKRDARVEEDELRRLREVAEKRRGDGGGAGEGRRGGQQDGETSSSSRDKKGKKRKTKKKKESKEKVKIAGTKPLDQVFGNTAMDPKPDKRKSIRKRARKAAKRKGKRGDSSTSSSRATSHESGSTSGEEGRLFGEEARVKMLWKRFPGALTLNTISSTCRPW